MKLAAMICPDNYYTQFYHPFKSTPTSNYKYFIKLLLLKIAYNIFIKSE
jgi:hypothetical protein